VVAAAASRCPFRYLAGRSTQEEENAAVNQSRCPFKNLLRTASTDEDGLRPSGVSHEATGGGAVARNNGTANPVATKCPLGFVAGSEPKMDVLNCALCGSLLHDAVALDCEHRACAYCATSAGCCGSCGKESKSFRSDPLMQGVVDLYLSSHGASAPGSGSAEGGANDSASFYLEVGLQSMAGGNLEAAYSRLQSCAEAVKSGQAGCAEDAYETSCRLAVVFGSLGDCSKRLGEQQKAISHYSESCTHWERAAAADSQVSGHS